MPIAYHPAADAAPGPPWSTALLSQRDLTLQVPLNFVTYPGISVAAACFGNNVYEENAAALCFSNLLALAIRRYTLDLYWDQGRQVWSFCPVQVQGHILNGPVTTRVNPTSASIPTFSSTRQPGLTAGTLNTQGTAAASAAPIRKRIPRLPELLYDRLAKRQSPITTSSNAASSTTSTSRTTPANSNTTSTIAANPAIQTSQLNGNTVYRNGLYTCSSSIDFDVFTTVLNGYLGNTSNTLATLLAFVQINLHVAAPMDAPTGTPAALNASQVPGPDQQIVDVLNANLTSYLYTPAILTQDRANLNASWYSVDPNFWPFDNYFTVLPLGPDGAIYTKDGWPSESYVEFQKAYRLLFSYGIIDPQLSSYNFNKVLIFEPGSIMNDRAVSYNTLGGLTQGCFYDPTNYNSSHLGNSWAVTSNLDLQPTIQSLGETIYLSDSNLTRCGISPVLNTTLNGTTADVNVMPYQGFSYSTIWSWLPGEPRVVSANETNADRIRCALMELSSTSSGVGQSAIVPTGGRWRITDCTERHFASCRRINTAYDWRINDRQSVYSVSEEQCPDGYTFDVPRTGLENTYLVAAAYNSSDFDSTNGISLWVDFNSLDVPGCWVTGANTTCPYTNADALNSERRIIVPVVAGILVLVVAALTLFVKCAANRQNEVRGRKRKNVGDGWDYEGVPS